MVLGDHMAPIAQQPLAADLKERGAADREAKAGFFGGEPERFVHGGSGVVLRAAWGSEGGYRKWVEGGYGICAKCIDSGQPCSRLTMVLRSEIHR
jgi:hypothetical protein